MGNADTVVYPDVRTAAALSGQWHVVVFNDPVNLMSYVAMVFRRVLGFDRATAAKHMLEVHQNGKSVVWTGGREQAENYTHQLQQWQLNARLIRART